MNDIKIEIIKTRLEFEKSKILFQKIENNKTIDPSIRTLLLTKMKNDKFKLNNLQNEYSRQNKKN